MKPIRLVYTPSAQNYLKKIHPSLKQAIRETIEELSLEPFKGKPLQGNKKGCYSLREGDYRVIYEVHLDDKVVHIIAVGHRKEIYR